MNSLENLEDEECDVEELEDRDCDDKDVVYEDWENLSLSEFWSEYDVVYEGKRNN